MKHLKRSTLKMALKLLGVSAACLLLEACYGTPTARYYPVNPESQSDTLATNQQVAPEVNAKVNE
ncbi:MAG: hypothetical protein KKA07_11615 [Bacteroidetes bacterium]|nr:hypothetical protein [Bacteroidota bacterium]MBU1719707.1 hypothetical protein [Bacteroidota bacterium]